MPESYARAPRFHFWDFPCLETCYCLITDRTENDSALDDMRVIIHTFTCEIPPSIGKCRVSFIKITKLLFSQDATNACACTLIRWDTQYMGRSKAGAFPPSVPSQEIQGQSPFPLTCLLSCASMNQAHPFFICCTRISQ